MDNLRDRHRKASNRGRRMVGAEKTGIKKVMHINYLRRLVAGLHLESTREPNIGAAVELWGRSGRGFAAG